MPLFEVSEDELVPFRRVQAGPELYESEIEDLLWQNIDAFVGQPLFPVARQANLGGGLIADVLALDKEGRVFVIEVKRDVDRRQLAQSLEYAGWARQTNLDELAGLFHEGTSEFFAAWMEFTGTDSPQLIRRPPQLVLVARDLDARTDSALAYLVENDLPVTVLRVNLYEDQEHRRFLDVGAEEDADVGFTSVAAVTDTPASPTHVKIEGRRVQLSDLVDAGLMQVGQTLTWHRPRLGTTYTAVVTESGALQLDDGRAFSSPSRAAMEAADVPAYDGWLAWRTKDGQLLDELRARLIEKLAAPARSDEEPVTSASADAPSVAPPADGHPNRQAHAGEARGPTPFEPALLGRRARLP